MANLNYSQIMGFDVERTVVAPYSGAFQALGTPLAFNPVIFILDNQSNVPVEISIDGVNVWKTFPALEALTIDCRSNHGIAPNYTPPLGTQFYVKGTAGAGQFSLSILYAK